MIVYFVRHASAGQKKASASADLKRPLDKDGIQQSTSVGRALSAMEIQVEAIISSPLKRVSQTAALIANELGFDSKITFSPALAPDATFESFRELLDKNSKKEAIMVVGHNPSMSLFLSRLLTNGVNDKAIDMKKAGVAKVELGSRRAAELDWYITPRFVRSLYEMSEDKSRPKTSRK